MDLSALTKRAVEVRSKYNELEIQQSGKAWTNLNLMEGFVGDIGDLMKLVMAKEGVRKIEDVDQKLAHELADCLWSVLVLADKYGINLEEKFLQTMQELNNRIEKEMKSIVGVE